MRALSLSPKLESTCYVAGEVNRRNSTAQRSMDGEEEKLHVARVQQTPHMIYSSHPKWGVLERFLQSSDWRRSGV
jgi:hypothetical protein